MNIACDARALIGPHTGVGTWTTQLVAGLADNAENRILLAASKPLNLPDELCRGNVVVLPPPRLPWPGTLWLHTALSNLLEAAEADVLIGSLAVLPRRCRIPSVLMVHDLTPRTHPSRHTLANRFCFNAYLEASLEAATAVVVGSTATSIELVHVFPRVRDKLTQISYGVDGFFSPTDDNDEAEITRRRFSGGKPFILHLGTLEPRKGIIVLIEAWEQLAAEEGPSPDLVLAGSEGWGTTAILERISRSPHHERIHRTGYVSRSDARALLRHASAFVLASEAEGFGLPLAEAIACGAVAVASDIPSLRECGGEAAIYVPPCNPALLADALRRALEPATAADLRGRTAERRSHLGWEPIVHSWETLLARVAATHRLDS